MNEEQKERIEPLVEASDPMIHWMGINMPYPSCKKDDDCDYCVAWGILKDFKQALAKYKGEE